MVVSIFVYGLLVWSFFHPSLASYGYLSFIVLFEGWLSVTYSLGKPNLAISSENWSDSELAALRKYHIAFRFPFAIRTITSGLRAITLSSFIWVPWLLFKHQWISAILIGLNCVFVLTYLQIRCSDPRPYLEKVINAGNLKYYDELKAINSIYEKLFASKNSSKIDSNHTKD